MKEPEYTTADGYEIESGIFVSIDPRACDKRHHMTAKVISPGRVSSLVLPANHKKTELIENRFLSVQKAKNQSRNIVIKQTLIKESPVNTPIRQNTSNQFNGTPKSTPPSPEPSPKSLYAIFPAATSSTATAADFDALAGVVGRLRESATAKLMQLHDDAKTARQMLAEANSKIDSHINQCRALGIEFDPTQIQPR